MSKILNYKYKGQPADLIHANPTGRVEGFHINNLSNNQTWDVVSVGENYITIRNLATGTYANPQYEADGAAVVGGFNPYKWQQKGVPGGWFQILTNDGEYGWYLTGGQDYAPIVLKQSTYTGEDAQWAYEPAN